MRYVIVSDRLGALLRWSPPPPIPVVPCTNLSQFKPCVHGVGAIRGVRSRHARALPVGAMQSASPRTRFAPLPRCTPCPHTQLPANAVDVEILHDATRREARGPA